MHTLWWLIACDPQSTRKASTTDLPHETAAPDSEPTQDSQPQDSLTQDSEVQDSTPPDSESTTWVLPPRPDTDHPATTDSWRWGGGSDYPDRVDPSWPTVTQVSDLNSLIAALNAAVIGDIVYIAPDAEIDLTGQSLCINAGVWLASNRGENNAPGGLLYATTGAAASVLKACGNDIRITGLRLRGPDPETCPDEWPNNCPEDVSGDSNCAYCTQTAYGISSFGFANMEVDNNELSGWTYASVGVKDATGADVHHNYIHHNWREGLGYGVVLYGQQATSALVRWNRFDAIRHAVAGQGYPLESYEARDNLMGENAIGHIFDMHGENEATGDGTSYAGNDIRIHNNIVLTADQYAMVIRGKPDTGAWLYENCLARSSSDAALQRYFSGNFYVDWSPSGVSAPNSYNQSDSDCSAVHWCVADGGNGPWRYGSASSTSADHLLVGDMDGDGKDDVFGSDGTHWRFANPLGGTWRNLAQSSTDLSALALVDLDGDHIDDVFYGSGSTWYWSKSGSSSWATLRSATETRADVAFGDFDGDGAMDIFTTDGHQWRYYPQGSGAAVSLAVASNSLSSLAFGDFDGDGITDVFTGDGSQWKWSQSGRSNWANLASSGNTVDTLLFADVDGDHITDVLTLSEENLRYSSGGKSSWKTLRYQHNDPFILGDFDGNGQSDVLTGNCL